MDVLGVRNKEAQSGTGMLRCRTERSYVGMPMPAASALMPMPGVRNKMTQSGIRMLRCWTEMSDARLPIPAASRLMPMPMPSYVKMACLSRGSRWRSLPGTPSALSDNQSRK